MFTFDARQKAATRRDTNNKCPYIFDIPVRQRERYIYVYYIGIYICQRCEYKPLAASGGACDTKKAGRAHARRVVHSVCRPMAARVRLSRTSALFIPKCFFVRSFSGWRSLVGFLRADWCQVFLFYGIITLYFNVFVGHK